jgi:NADPH:quinone reductase
LNCAISRLEHDPEKWKPVFRKGHAQIKKLDHDAIDRIMIINRNRASSRARTVVQEIGKTLMSAAPKKPNGSPIAVEARCVRLPTKADNPSSIEPVIEQRALSRAENEVLIEVKAAAVNPSDVKAATGLMPYAVFPRTPGRDYAGIVIDGPREVIGREVFGSSGDLGIRRDGTHATHLAVEAEAIVEKPKNISWEEAAGIGVPFVTAMEGFRRAGMPKKGETVLVMGVNGKVGQAAVQIATWHGARAIGVVRKSEAYEGHANSGVDVIDASNTDVATRVRELTDGKGADIVFNTVGDPYFQAAHKSLALRGRQILIAAIDRIVQFNILEFYRGQHTYVGIDTLGLSSIATGAVLRELGPGFASGHLKPFPIKPNAVHPLEKAKRAFLAVAGSSRDRVILRPE